MSSWRKKLLEVNNITLEAAMDKVWKWEASREQANQMVTPSQEAGAGTNAVEETSGRGSKEKCAKHVSTVVKRVTLLKTGIIQHEVGSVVNVENMVIMLAVATGEEAQSQEKKTLPNDGEVDSDVMVRKDRPILLRVLLRIQVRMTHLLLL